MGSELPGPGLMSFTRTVPAAVPSVLHSSDPVPSSAAKKSVPPTLVNPVGLELPGRLMSATRTVPLSVPSLLHSSDPPTPSSAANARESVPGMFVISRRLELPGPGLMSATRTVPAAVPSLFHSSDPPTPSSAEKKSVPPTFVRSTGPDPLGPGLMSFTRTVPASVPSVLHSSLPPIPTASKRVIGPIWTNSPGSDPNAGISWMSLTKNGARGSASACSWVTPNGTITASSISND